MTLRVTPEKHNETKKGNVHYYTQSVHTTGRMNYKTTVSQA